ncbi:platelet-activating factor acetylhydrolase isoform II [Herbihabitans rhizosphaerae]|uniref:Platelet-activating factor acetylhydrolase isoform II n=1 Tax=Herbihabitans rhizosphaerae TaxID=1872711 RepID=A0A4Q7L403_9PSEU|nr:alpha/beta hydrolase [Herbihabitans rhizosphaerae]RZS44349.1 platelet-activating factor acetylhydrolase isoform II [Herbihabitans rhizosphaerae]
MRGRTVATVLTATALTAVAVSASPAVAAPALHLPEPTGRQPVGTTSLYLKDTSRPDPWVPSVNARELMVSVFYPARSAHGETKRYMTPVESKALLEESGLAGVPPDVLSTVRTNAIVDAPPVTRRPHSIPLVVLSPGFKKSRATLSSLAEDLASHGNIVAVVDHTYENVATTFPDGRVTTCVACGDYNDAFWHKLQWGRGADVSFVLDELTGPRSKWRGANLIDPSKIAMAGHSVGGASAVQAMLGDTRIKAGIDMDGMTNVPLPAPGLSRPFLLLGRQNTYTPGTPGGPAASWERDWPLLTGWKRWLTVEGMEHPTFTDVGVLAGQYGIDFGATIDADRALEITRTYVRAFFHLHLRGRPQPLMAAPSPLFPEVTFHG